MNNKWLIVIVGPTAVGKTGLSVELAVDLESEIISADSRQFFRELEIGTAKPSKKELEMVKHYFVNSHSIHDDYDAGSFATDVEDLLISLFREKDVILMVGGSGLYVSSVCDGLDEMPEISFGLREKLNLELKENGLDRLLEELKSKDLEHFDRIDKKNPQRVVRALEVIRSTNRTYSSFRVNKKVRSKDYSVLKIGLELEKEKLYQRIDKRMDLMIEEGLFEEAKSFYEFKQVNALQTVGYREIFPFFDGEYDREEAVRLLKRNSRRYAKRQMTWFKRDEEIQWFRPSQKDEILKLILSKTEESQK